MTSKVFIIYVSILFIYITYCVEDASRIPDVGRRSYPLMVAAVPVAIVGETDVRVAQATPWQDEPVHWFDEFSPCNTVGQALCCKCTCTHPNIRHRLLLQSAAVAPTPPSVSISTIDTELNYSGPAAVT